MTETVLRNAAVRAAHEIAWLREETRALLAYADRSPPGHRPPTSTPRSPPSTPRPRDSLHLADVVTVYELAGRAFEAALAAAQRARGRRSRRRSRGNCCAPASRPRSE